MANIIRDWMIAFNGAKMREKAFEQHCKLMSHFNHAISKQLLLDTQRLFSIDVSLIFSLIVDICALVLDNILNSESTNNAHLF